MATLPGAWRYRVSVGTGRSGVSILWLGEVESSICSFCLSVAACKIEHVAGTLSNQPTNKQTNRGNDKRVAFSIFECIRRHFTIVTYVRGNDKRVAFSTFEYIRRHFTIATCIRGYVKKVTFSIFEYIRRHSTIVTYVRGNDKRVVFGNLPE